MIRLRCLGLILGRRRAVDPLRGEHVDAALVGRRAAHAPDVARGGVHGVASPRRERQRLAVGREHREAVESRIVGDALEVRAVGVDREQIERGALRRLVVRAEDDPLAVREEVRRERCARQVRDLVRLGAVGVGDPQVHLRRLDEVLRVQRLVLLEILAGRPRRAPHDLRAILREERAAVVAHRVRELAQVGAVGVHPPQLEIARALRREDDRAVFRAHRRLGVVARRAGQLAAIRAVGVRAIDVVLEEAPVVALRHVGRRRALRPVLVGRRVDDLFIAFQEVRAGRAALAGRHQLARAAGRRHLLDLIALIRLVVGLEDQLIAVERPVRFGIVTAERQLFETLQVMELERCREAL